MFITLPPPLDCPPITTVIPHPVPNLTVSLSFSPLHSTPFLQDLIAADSNGLSDPFALLTLENEKRASSVVNKSLNPMWKERFRWLVKVRGSHTHHAHHAHHAHHSCHSCHACHACHSCQMCYHYVLQSPVDPLPRKGKRLKPSLVQSSDNMEPTPHITSPHLVGPYHGGASA